MDYEVMNPWAEVDPIPQNGIGPRVTDLNGKTIGMFAFFKPHGPVIMKEMEKHLKERFPEARFSHYWYPKHVMEIVNDPEYKPSFDEWLNGVDAVISGHGD